MYILVKSTTGRGIKMQRTIEIETADGQEKEIIRSKNMSKLLFKVADKFFVDEWETCFYDHKPGRYMIGHCHIDFAKAAISVTIHI